LREKEYVVICDEPCGIFFGLRFEVSGWWLVVEDRSTIIFRGVEEHFVEELQIILESLVKSMSNTLGLSSPQAAHLKGIS